MNRRILTCLIPGVMIVLGFLQARAQTAPPDGLRDNTPAYYAFVNARIVQSPGKVIDRGTLVIRDGVIESVGSGAAPEGAYVWDLNGLSVYPGLIDLSTGYGMPPPPPQGRGNENQPRKPDEPERGPRNWNDQVRADQDAAALFRPDDKEAAKLRSQGFTTVLSIPTTGIFRGTSALVHTGDGQPNDLVVKQRVAQHVTFARDRGSDGYPNSLMGVISLIRQTMLDADWYARARAAYAGDRSLPRPEQDDALEALGDVLIGSLPVMIETSNEREFLRADRIAKEFGLDLIVRGSGNEYRRLDAIIQTKRPVVLPLNFPNVPDVATPEAALQVSLEDLLHWDNAPENPARLRSSSVSMALTSAELKDIGSFLGNVRTAITRGLKPDDALTALTMTPARLLGMEKQLGSIEKGKIADFLVTDGDLFGEKSKIREAWIDGKRYTVNALPDADLRGTWALHIGGVQDTPTLKLTGTPDELKGALAWPKETKLSTVSFSNLRLALSFSGDSVGHPGVIRMTGILSGNELSGAGEWPNGSAFTWTGTRSGAYVPEPDTSKTEPPSMASFPLVYPLGAFGRERIPDQPAAVVIRNATIWTCGPDGRLEQADMLVEKGTITAVGRSIKAPSGAVVIDGTGKHITPGLIDAHSHMAADAINEAGQAISAEVRIGDVINADDISIYRALAGGLTSAHILHGSANPIGGQCQLIKLRWGMLPEEVKFAGAPGTIKFALGENVKQSNWGDNFTSRYPQTRMGVEQIMRDEFNAARAYEDALAHPGPIPTRRDLELDAIVEILHSKRFVHCHSYRQDEILATMRVAEDFGFRIRVFQHILEGYKVADIMAKHGVGGSTFSDWWAYKFEVYDAIPYNGALMHDQGVLVSFNSDSDELARRLNTEAAKAVKWGGLSEEEALKFVTINPARQLFVDKQVGSLEAGKDADFVIWNGNPLSTYTLCEQTWVDGRRFFDREEDQILNEEANQYRATLIQKALKSKEKPGKGDPRRGPGRMDASGEHYSCTETEGGF